MCYIDSYYYAACEHFHHSERALSYPGLEHCEYAPMLCRRSRPIVSQKVTYRGCRYCPPCLAAKIAELTAAYQQRLADLTKEIEGVDLRHLADSGAANLTERFRVGHVFEEECRKLQADYDGPEIRVRDVCDGRIVEVSVTQPT